ncbi:acyltransferase [Candidatus Parcubacteria bacterium]|nr:acyltransferase [Candidatus Parcubacteria bacterium]
MTLESQAQNTQKIGSINTLRFIAAAFVVFYHYAFAFYYRDLSYVDLPFFRYIFQYGYLGVDLFFIISGFVISLSAENRNAYNFFKSRVGRLYPVFWISAIITTLFILFGGHLIYSEMSWSRFLTNMTMIPSFFNADPLDGTYWTLLLEMKFYFIILLLILFKQFKRIEKFAIPLAVIMLAVSVFRPDLAADSQWIWVPNFIAGVLFYKIYKEGLTNTRIFALCTTLISSLVFALKRIPYLSEGYGIAFKPSVISLYILFFYLIFLLISLNKFKIPNNRFVNILGLLTYPVYLLHHQIGKILFTYADIQNIPLYVSFTCMILFIGVLSFAVHHIFESRGRKILDKILDKSVPLKIKNL